MNGAGGAVSAAQSSTMSTSPSQEHQDLDRLVDIFDKALTSEDPRIKKCLKDLLLITALINPDPGVNPYGHQGPMRSMISRLDGLSRRMSLLETNGDSDMPENFANKMRGSSITNLPGSSTVGLTSPQEIMQRLRERK